MSGPRPWMSRPAVWVFAAYAAALFIATHWPALKVSTELMRRPDLLAHMLVFGAWTALLFLSGLAGSPSPRTAARCAVIGIVYAAIDESLQAIPFLRRTAALDDYLFNVAGVLAAAVICGGASALAARRTARRSAA